MPTILKRWGGTWGASDLKNMGWNMGRRDFLKHGAKYGVPTILKTWGKRWGANDFRNMGWNMGCQ